MASGSTAHAVAWTPGEERARSVRIVGRDHMVTLDTNSNQVAPVWWIGAAGGTWSASSR